MNGKIWHIYDINGTTENEEEDLEFSFVTSTPNGDDPKKILAFLTKKGAKKGLLDLFKNNSKKFCDPDIAYDLSSDNETIYISQEHVEFME